MYFTSNGGFQNTFVYQPTLDILEFKKDKDKDYVSWKSKGVYILKFNPLYTTFFHGIKLRGYRMGIKRPFSYRTKQLCNQNSKYFYIFYDVDAWPRNPSNNFNFRNRLFRATNIVKISDK